MARTSSSSRGLTVHVRLGPLASSISVRKPLPTALSITRSISKVPPPRRGGTTTVGPSTESGQAAVRIDDGTRTAATPQPGANSFTEGQARSRIEAAGFSNVTELQKDDQGIWRGRGMRNVQQVGVALDFTGAVTSR